MKLFLKIIFVFVFFINIGLGKRFDKPADWPEDFEGLQDRIGRLLREGNPNAIVQPPVVNIQPIVVEDTVQGRNNNPDDVDAEGDSDGEVPEPLILVEQVVPANEYDNLKRFFSAWRLF